MKAHAAGERSLARTSLVAWGMSGVALLLGGAGLFAVTSSGTTTSLVRMGVAAGILALLGAVVAVVVVPAWSRTAGRRWCWAVALPVLVGAATAALVGLRSGAEAGLFAGLPWWSGALVGGAVSAFLPDLSWRSLRQRRADRRDRRW